MCGIAGILRFDGEPIPESALDALDSAIAHRGPDGEGRFRDDVSMAGAGSVAVALVHRRLSILDHDGGAQPMVSVRGRRDGEGLVAVVFNGCIYNHRELRRELESQGHRFVSDHSDTEVLVHGHRAWGAALPQHLEGMYAYAIWDRFAGAVTLARDPFGEKPLHCRVHRRGSDGPVTELWFCTARAAVSSLHRDAETDRGQLNAWTTRYLQSGYEWGARCGEPPPSSTARLPAGGTVHCAAGTITTGSTAPGPGSTGPTASDPGPSEDELAHRLEIAVGRRLEADVPLGCFLSGGVDSSLIAFFAHRQRPDLRTFSVRMPDPRFDESAHAERVARLLGTTHTTLEVSPDPAADLLHLVDHLGQPFADSSILPTHWVSRAARDHVTVALSGDGGDELFLGYERYVAAPLLARHWRRLRHLPTSLRTRAHPRSRRDKAGRLGAMARDYPRLGVLAAESIFTTHEIASLLGDAFDPGALVRASAGPDTARAVLRAHDLAHYLPEDLLVKVDTASMAVALEVRAPFLDRDLAAVALAAPLTALMPHSRRKGLLRAIARRHLPAEVVDRPKMGFAIPIGEWFRTNEGGLRELLHDQLGARDAFGPITLDRKATGRLLQEHASRRRDHGHKLFALLTLALWARR